jgi:hypothetical protein
MAFCTPEDNHEKSKSMVTDNGFTEKIKITDDICPAYINLITSDKQFIVYSNYKERWGDDKSIYSFEYIRNFDKDITGVKMETVHGEVTVTGSFVPRD